MESQFWPFTDVLRAIWLAVTRKVRTPATADIADLTDRFLMVLVAAHTREFAPDLLDFLRLRSLWRGRQDSLETLPTNPSESRLYLCDPRNPRSTLTSARERRRFSRTADRPGENPKSDSDAVRRRLGQPGGFFQLLFRGSRWLNRVRQSTRRSMPD
jgi:hypothetical protein